MKKCVSIIIPVYNEEHNIDPLIQTLTQTLAHYEYEILFIDDGSTDNTVASISIHTKANKTIKLISFYRNFGHQMALAAGYENARGDCVISMDADLQDPPEIIPELIAKWESGAKIVYAKRKNRDVDSPFKKLTAYLFYRCINLLSDEPIPQEVGDFRLLDRDVVDFLNNLSEKPRFLRGLVAWGGFPAEFVYFSRMRRNAGHTHYTFSKMMNFALEGITSFSTKPLRISIYLGFTSAFVGFIGVLYAILGRIFFAQYWVTGWAALFVGIMFMGGVQLITIGIIGEYIGKIYSEIQKRPRYIIRSRINI